MLEIRIAGNYLDLPPDISLSLVIENPLFLQDRIPSLYSLTFALPATPGNLKAYKYPNRVASVQDYELIEDVDIIIDGMGFSSGTSKLDTYDKGVLNVLFVGSAFIPKPEQLMYNAQLDKYELDLCVTKDEVLTESGFYPSLTTLLATTVDGSANFVCPPVRIENDKQFADIDITETVPYTKYGDGSSLYAQFIRGLALHAGVLVKNIAQIAYANFWNTDLHKWRYQDQHMPNAYMPRIGYMFDKVFRGGITNNVFNTDAELSKLVLENGFSLAARNFMTIALYYGCIMDEYLPGDSGHDVPAVPFFRLNSSLASSKIGDFLKDILKLTCVSLYPAAKGGYVMAFAKDIMNSTESDDWTSLVAGEILLSLRKRQTYKYGYSGNVLSELGDNPVYQNTHKQMLNIPISSLPTQCKVVDTGEIFKISLPEVTDLIKLPPYTDNLVVGRYYKGVDDYIVYHDDVHQPVDTIFQCIAGYISFGGVGKVVDVTPDVWVFECINQGLGGYVDPLVIVDLDEAATPDGDYSMESAVAPLPMTIDKNWRDDYGTARFGEWMVPVMKDARYVRPTEPRIGLYHGLQKCFNNVDVYPYVSSHNRDTQGTVIGGLSLSWDGDDGLLATYHQEFQAWVEKNKKAITCYMRLDALALRNLDLRRKKNIRGVDFFIEKIQVTIKLRTIELAQVDLIEC